MSQPIWDCYSSISDTVDYALDELKRLQSEQNSDVNIENIQEITPATAVNSQPKRVDLDYILEDLDLD